LKADRNAIISYFKKKEQIARRVILNEYFNRIVRQSVRLTGNQSLLESHQHTEDKSIADKVKNLLGGK